MSIITILAADIQQGDVWLGDDGVELVVRSVDTWRNWQDFIPWKAGRNTPPVKMPGVKIYGSINQAGTYSGEWTLQPDMPVQVRREREDGVDV